MRSTTEVYALERELTNGLQVLGPGFRGLEV